MNFLKLFKDSFIDNWDLPAVTDYATGLTLTYAGLAGRIQRVRKFLELLNVSPGTHIGVAGPNSIDWIANYFASMLHSAVTVTAQTLHSPAEVLSLLSAADCEILFVDRKMCDLSDVSFAEMPTVNLVIDGACSTVLYCREGTYTEAAEQLFSLDSYFMGLYPNGLLVSDISVPDVKPGAEVAIFFTSGTMGDPRAVVLTSDCFEANVIHTLNNNMFPTGSHTITSISMSNVWGTIYCVMAPLASGASITVFSEFYKPREFLAAIRRVRPERVIMSPGMLRDTYRIIEAKVARSPYYAILRHLPFSGKLINASLRYTYNRAIGGRCKEIIAGSTNMERSTRNKLHSVGLRFSIAYGLAECGGMVAYSPGGSFVSATVGNSVNSLVSCRLRPLEIPGLPDGIGIVETRGMSMMKGYYNDPEGTAEAFTDDGWFSTRDLATISPDGLVTIIGRLDTIIRRPGGTIVPERLEATINEQPEVGQSLVVDRDGTLTAIVLPAAPDAPDADDAVRRAIDRVNATTPDFIHIDRVDIVYRPLDMTLKGTPARYRYL